jgi:hypothetical protein
MSNEIYTRHIFGPIGGKYFYYDENLGIFLEDNNLMEENGADCNSSFTDISMEIDDKDVQEQTYIESEKEIGGIYFDDLIRIEDNVNESISPARSNAPSPDSTVFDN